MQPCEETSETQAPTLDLYRDDPDSHWWTGPVAYRDMRGLFGYKSYEVLLGVMPRDIGQAVSLNLHDPQHPLRVISYETESPSEEEFGVPGHMLIVSDRQDAIVGQLAILAATTCVEEAGDIELFVMTGQPEVWEDLSSLKQINSVTRVDDVNATDEIMDNLSRLLHYMQRTGLQQGDHPYVLMIDDLAATMYWSKAAREALHELLCFGPEYHVWVIAGLDNAQLEGFVQYDEYDWMGMMQTRWFTGIQNPETLHAWGIPQQVDGIPVVNRPFGQSVLQCFRSQNASQPTCLNIAVPLEYGEEPLFETEEILFDEEE